MAASVILNCGLCTRSEGPSHKNTLKHKPLVCKATVLSPSNVVAFRSAPSRGPFLHKSTLTHRGAFLNGPRPSVGIVNVAAPHRTTLVSENEDNGEEKKRKKQDFDPSASPPFTLADVRAAIPKHCWVKSAWKSLSYVARDVAVVFGLAAAAAYFNNWALWPLYWIAQGTMFWALFVVGHDW